MKYKQMMHRNQFYRHNVTYSFWGLCPQTPTGALPLDPAGGLPSPDLLISHILHPPCHYILDKGLMPSLIGRLSLRGLQFFKKCVRIHHNVICRQKIWEDEPPPQTSTVRLRACKNS